MHSRPVGVLRAEDATPIAVDKAVMFLSRCSNVDWIASFSEVRADKEVINVCKLGYFMLMRKVEFLLWIIFRYMKTLSSFKRYFLYYTNTKWIKLALNWVSKSSSSSLLLPPLPPPLFIMSTSILFYSILFHSVNIRCYGARKCYFTEIMCMRAALICPVWDTLVNQFRFSTVLFFPALYCNIIIIVCLNEES